MRCERIFENVDVETIVLANSTEPHLDLSFFYVTGFFKGLFENCVAVVEKNGLELYVSSLEEESARSGDFEVHVFKDKEELKKLLRKRIGDLKRIGINAEELTYSKYLELKKLTKAEFVDVSEAIKKARVVKGEDEIERLRKACKIASRVADKIPEMILEGIKEYELAAEISYMIGKEGSQGLGFTPIVAFGKNSSEPHYTGGDVSLKKGDFVLCDFGAMFERYSSDITRTYCFGRATKEQQKMYDVVLMAQEKSLEMMKEGVEARDVHIKAQNTIDEIYKGRFIHGIGHSIGLSVHDGFAMNSKAKFKLEEGMVFTVEPGIYIPNFGGVRIEDDVLIKKNGVEILTNARKELIEI